MTDARISILFICMGNICRSPLAEGLFRHKANERGVIDLFSIDSAGTGGWHAGEMPDHRMRRAAKRYGITLTSRARQVTKRDFQSFDYLICMDDENRQIIISRGAPKDKVLLLLEFDQTHDVKEVPDPYYGGDDGFEYVYQLVDSACEHLLDTLLTKHEQCTTRQSDSERAQ